MKKQSKKTLRNKADKLLQEVICKLFPKCLLCGGKTQVGHHFIKKSESSKLRYSLKNIIPLCKNCHFRLHCHETIWSNKITLIKGQDWFKELDKEKSKYVKTDKEFYLKAIEVLNKLL